MVLHGAPLSAAPARRYGRGEPARGSERRGSRDRVQAQRRRTELPTRLRAGCCNGRGARRIGHTYPRGGPGTPPRSRRADVPRKPKKGEKENGKTTPAPAQVGAQERAVYEAQPAPGTWALPLPRPLAPWGLWRPRRRVASRAPSPGSATSGRRRVSAPGTSPGRTSGRLSPVGGAPPLSSPESLRRGW